MTDPQASFYAAILGGALTLVGGIVTTLWTDYRNQVRTEERLLEEIESKLDDYFIRYSLAKALSKENPDIFEVVEHAQSPKGQMEARQMLEQIQDMAWRLKTRRHRDLAAYIVKIDIKEHPFNVLDTLNEIRRRINPSLAKVKAREMPDAKWLKSAKKYAETSKDKKDSEMPPSTDSPELPEKR